MPNTSDAVTMVDSSVLAAVREEIEKAGHFMLQDVSSADAPSNEVTLWLHPSADAFAHGSGDARGSIRLRLVFQPQTVVLISVRSGREPVESTVVNKRTADRIRDWVKAAVTASSRERAEAA